MRAHLPEVACLNYREAAADVLLMAGGRSRLPWLAPALDRLTDGLPSAQVREFPKLNHFRPDRKNPAEAAEAGTGFFGA